MSADSAQVAPELVPVVRRYMNDVPHNRALGLRVVDFARDFFTVELPYDPRLVGNPETGVLHGGVITAAMDSASGGAVLVALDRPQRIVTLDLRIDYLRAATPHEAVVCRASCYKAGYHVAFTRAVAYHDDPAAPIATASGTFVIFRTPPPTAAGGPDGSEGAAT
ncbi:MAG: PaaI family thioesterase [Myxococcales bacterium]|nr:PaaI family thioesterase [Myxococcales bacterium]